MDEYSSDNSLMNGRLLRLKNRARNFRFIHQCNLDLFYIFF